MRYLDRLIRWITFYSKKEWIFVGSIAALIGVLYLPWAYQYIWERELLVTEGVSTVGKVVSHTLPGNRICAHPIVVYVVEGKSYSIELYGCQVGPKKSWANFVFMFVVMVIGLATWRQYLEKPPPRV
jgi:hypothetical protein